MSETNRDITVSDLKIGSLISFNDYTMEAFFVEEIAPDQEEPGYVPPPDQYIIRGKGGKNGTWINPVELVEGIPITIPILNAIGIQEIYGYDISSNHLNTKITITPEERLLVFHFKVDGTFIRLWHENNPYGHIKYIHQLQEFFPMTTGTKLVITEEHRKAVCEILSKQ